jgi:hypothetical protein
MEKCRVVYRGRSVGLELTGACRPGWWSPLAPRFTSKIIRLIGSDRNMRTNSEESGLQASAETPSTAAIRRRDRKGRARGVNVFRGGRASPEGSSPSQVPSLAPITKTAQRGYDYCTPWVGRCTVRGVGWASEGCTASRGAQPRAERLRMIRLEELSARAQKRSARLLVRPGRKTASGPR